MKNALGNWQHAAIVSAITGDCNNPANIIVDSHTPYVRAPLNYSEFSPYSLYSVIISGYRK
jgi:hypothetical protein